MKAGKVIIAVDLTDDCLTTLKRISALDLPPTCEIHLVHVFELISLKAAMEQFFNEDKKFLEKVRQAGQKKLEEFQGRLDFSRFQKIISTCLVAPNSKQEFLVYANQVKPDFIITASHEREGFRNLFEGSFNSFLSRFCPYDLIVLRPNH